MRIAGSGWVTPLGSDIAEVWRRLLVGDEAEAVELADEVNKYRYKAFRVSPSAMPKLPPHPRLRRASAISRFAAAAGLAALASAKSSIGEIDPAAIALVLAVSNGGVIYTRRFYHEIATTGAGGASPLLFPETVFNAPASHLAAILGIEGATYTLVGDGAVGMLAMRMAEDLLGSMQCEHCLVIAAEEADWLLCDAYRRWRLLRAAPPVEPFRQPSRGLILSEGAGAVLLSRAGRVSVDAINPGGQFSNRQCAAREVETILRGLTTASTQADLVVASANGTFVDEAEGNAISKHLAGALVYAPKAVLGDSVGASALWQVIVAAEALETGEVPAMRHRPATAALRLSGGHLPRQDRSAIVLSCGVNQQVAGLRLSI